MTKFEFLPDLEDIIVETFNVLDNRYASDMAREVEKSVYAAIKENEIRYLLIDGETGQLESRRLFESYQEALDDIKDMNLTHCIVGTLILER